MSFRSKARPAKLWELSSQGTEIRPQNCQIEVQWPSLATNDSNSQQNAKDMELYPRLQSKMMSGYFLAWQFSSKMILGCEGRYFSLFKGK